MLEVQLFGTDLEILHQCCKRVKTKSQKILGANSCFCRSYRGKAGRGIFYPPILNRVKDIDDNKNFWKTIKPFFSYKGLNTNKLMLIEDKNLISEEFVLANTMNQYFTNITKQLNVKNLAN